MSRASSLIMVAVLQKALALRRHSNKVHMRSDTLGVISSANETTGRGCTCTNECGATAAEGFRCDWCNVESGCGEWSLTRGQFDFCAYKQDKFMALSANSKLSQLWDEVRADTTVGPLLTKLQAVPKILTKSMITTFDNTREYLPSHRPKHTHANGVVSLIDFEVASGSPYTGMLRPGKHRALMRLASARSPQDDSTFPGLAIKFLRSGIHSANIVGLRHNGEESGQIHFFEEYLSTHVVPSALVDATQKFHQATGCRSLLGMSDVTAYEEDGSAVQNMNFPYRILFEAPDKMQFAVNPNAQDKTKELLNKLKSIPSGTHLYNMYAVAEPGASKVYLGKIHTVTAQTTSLFGDTKLFFRHQRMEEDFMKRPSWVSRVDLPLCDDSTDKQGKVRPLAEWQCPDVDGVPPL